jgi:hypothetical protein
LSSANCWAGILKNEKPIAACVSFYFLMFHLLFFFLILFSFFFPVILNGGDTLMGIKRNMGEKNLAGALRLLNKWEKLLMANVQTEPYCDKVESDFWVLREKRIP